MGIAAELKMYGRFSKGLHNFLRQSITLEQAVQIVQQRLAARESNFLQLVEKRIFGYKESPYLPLLDLAGCEFGDIKNTVRSKGLEATLTMLRENGVYFTFEEIKGREPVIRNGRTIAVNARNFDNPFLAQYYQAESSGTTGKATKVSLDLNHYSAQAPLIMLASHAHGVLNAPKAIWFGTLPDSTGIGSMLVSSPFNNIPRQWFASEARGKSPSQMKSWLATRYIITMTRLFGLPFPWPKSIGMDQVDTIVTWITKTLQSHETCVVSAHVSKALRICISARENGLDLTGTVFWGGGEPPTEAKIREIHKAGARWIPSYWFKEVGCVGQGCCNPIDNNDIHLFKDALILNQHERKIPGTDINVDAFYFTTLLPTAPKILLNVESDDYGVVEKRSCGCLLEQYGFTDHIRHIRSFRKLTGEGVTLIGGEIVHILEEVLPVRFGGSPLDYQMLEEEDEKGFTKLSLVVSPKIVVDDDTELLDAFVHALGKSSIGGNLAKNVLLQANTLRVSRRDPVWTSRGKLMPLHLANRLNQSADKSQS